MKRMIASLVLAAAAVFFTVSAHATGMTSDAGYKTARQAALRGGAMVLNKDSRLREFMGVKRPGDTRKAIHASQLIMKKAVSKSPQGLTTRYLVETQKLGKDGKPLASVVVSVRKISQETQRETKRAGRFIVSTGAKTDAKVRRRQGLPPAFISAQE